MNQYQVPEKMRKYTDYDMITHYTELPQFPHLRTKLLYAFLSECKETSLSETELYSLVTSLVQMGLDTHDMVEATEPGTSQKHNRPIQLRVLAGDYFSSRFYQLLAQAGRVEWVKKLSQAICEVNRIKVNFYMLVKQLKLNAEDYMRQMVQIRSTLFLPFSQLIDGEQKTIWPDVLKMFTKCELIAEEMERLNCPDKFRQSWAYWYLLQECNAEEQQMITSQDSDKIGQLIYKYQLSSKLREMLDTQIKQLGVLISRFESDKLMREVSRVAEFYKQRVISPKVLEEI